MSNHVLILFGVFLVLFLLQSAGGIFQIKDYEKAVRRVNRDGAVGIGQKRGRLLSGGHIVILACDDGGRITGGEAMDGISFLARFHPVSEVYHVRILGRDVYKRQGLRHPCILCYCRGGSQFKPFTV